MGVFALEKVPVSPKAPIIVNAAELRLVADHAVAFVFFQQDIDIEYKNEKEMGNIKKISPAPAPRRRWCASCSGEPGVSCGHLSKYRGLQRGDGAEEPAPTCLVRAFPAQEIATCLRSHAGKSSAAPA